MWRNAGRSGCCEDYLVLKPQVKMAGVEDGLKRMVAELAGRLEAIRAEVPFPKCRGRH
jgi:hypothetical protein